VYDPTVDTLVRQAGVAGPIVGERAETIGAGQVNVAMSFAYVALASIDGRALDGLVNRPRVNGQTLVFPIPKGTTLADGRVTTFLPVRVVADLDVRAAILSPSVTYGLTPDLDVNLTVPLLRTSLGVSTRARAPDPRFAQFALPRGTAFPVEDQSLSDDAEGIGDVLVRAKYVLRRGDWVDAAAALGLSVPTGRQRDLQGTGATRLQPALVLSHVFAGRLEPLVNVGVDIPANDAARSIVEWAVGGTYQALDRLSMSLVFLGRNELAAQSAPIPTPFFFQITRADQYDASVGCRWRFADAGLLGVNAIVPLNDAGLRARVIPTLDLEYAF
jgi:hypothetical protein